MFAKEEYDVWKIRMQVHLEAQDDDIWFVITNGPMKIPKVNTALAIADDLRGEIWWYCADRPGSRVRVDRRSSWESAYARSKDVHDLVKAGREVKPGQCDSCIEDERKYLAPHLPAGLVVRRYETMDSYHALMSFGNSRLSNLVAASGTVCGDEWIATTLSHASCPLPFIRSD
ncbi:hypothetical protein F511_20991 [Dorcoceras hygrometricum]|uniref:Uncharacterized protein n=1 Tax=Dorcoceras hygrometricum TaxID=472368 RepID=A0A2Z7CXX1_9LAMI|nr:hypothetical protein F511_20991 [Dorcoceras hygrometricum]